MQQKKLNKSNVSITPQAKGILSANNESPL